MKSKQRKIEELADLQSKIPGSKITVFTTFAPPATKKGEKGLSVGQMTELRRLLRALNADYVVTKKTIIDRAFQQVQVKLSDGFDIFDMEGSPGLVMGGDDPYMIAKKIYEFGKKNQALKFFGAMFDGAFINTKAFIEIAKLPSREQLLTRLFGMLMYPVTSLTIVMKQISDKKLTTN